MATVPAFPDFIDNQYVTEDDLDAIKIAGQFLMSPPRCSADDNSAAFGIANAAWTQIGHGTEQYDVSGMHSTTVQPERMTAVYAGHYLCSGSINFPSPATGGTIRAARWALNGVGYGPELAVTGGGDKRITLPSLIIPIGVGEYVTLDAYQDSGGPIYAGYSIMNVLWVGIKP